MDELPAEILLCIARFCRQGDIFSLLQVSPQFRFILGHELYRRNVRFERSSAVFRCLFSPHGTDVSAITSTWELARAAGADFNGVYECAEGNIHNLYGPLQPLHVALAMKEPGLVNALLNHGASIVSSIEDYELWAIKKGNPAGAAAMLRRLHAEGHPIHSNTIHWAAAYHQRPAIETLLSFGEDLNTVDSAGFTPLQIAVQNPKRSNQHFLAWFIEAGADPNLQTAHGTALSVACALGRFDYALELVQTPPTRICYRDFGHPNQNDNLRWSLYRTDSWHNGAEQYRNNCYTKVWVDWLLCLRPVISITPTAAVARPDSPTLAFPLAVQSLEDNIDGLPHTTPLPVTNNEPLAIGTPIDLLVDATLFALLSTRYGDARGAQHLLEAGCRVPNQANNGLLVALNYIFVNGCTVEQIQHRYASLLDILPIFMVLRPPVLNLAEHSAMLHGIARILEAHNDRLSRAYGV